MSRWSDIKVFVSNKRFLKLVGWVVLTYALIIGTTMFYLDIYTNHGEQIEVPNLIGQRLDNVKNNLDELGLQYEILDSIYEPSKPEGTILDQDPNPTKLSQVFVKEGRIIRLRVSKKSRLVEMPSLVDKTQRFAESILESRGLKYRIQFRPTNEANGAVLEQLYKGRPVKEGIRIPIGAVITLIVGQNDLGVPAEIPDLFGLTIFEAKDRLAAAGNFVYMPVCNDCSTYEDSLAARITSQSPEYLEGVLVPAGTTITVYATKNFSEAELENP